MKKIIFGTIIILILGLIGWFVYSTLQPSKEQNNTLSLPSIDPQSNLLENKVPELNPVQQANPFSGSYQNPFKK